MTEHTRSPQKYDVVIVGAGPTGLVLANLLGRAGVKTLLVEEDIATVGEPRAVSIDDESLRTIQSLGLLDAVMDGIVPGYGSDYRTAAGKVFLRVEPREQPYGHPRRNAFRQPVLEKQLRDGLARYPNVETLFGCHAEHFLDDGGSVTTCLRSGDSGAITNVSSQYLIGCDGARSLIRSQLGAELGGTSFSERWLIVDLENAPASDRNTIVFCDPKRACIALPGPGQTRRYEFKLFPDESDDTMLLEEKVARLLADHGADPKSKLVRKTIYRFHARVANSWRKGRVMIAGDAAHLTPPFAGQGMNSGIRDAENLAWKLAAVVNGQLGDRLLDSYQRERFAHVWSMISLALTMGVIMAPRSRLHAFLTQTMFWLSGFWPVARNYLAEMRYKPAPYFRTGFIVRQSKLRRSIVGRQIPQPSLIDQEVAWLDELLGTGFTLLGIDLDAAVVNNLSLGRHWDALISRRVSLPLASIPTFSRYRGQIFLVRPDRYVLAQWRLSELERIKEHLECLWRETWRKDEPDLAMQRAGKKTLECEGTRAQV